MCLLRTIKVRRSPIKLRANKIAEKITTVDSYCYYAYKLFIVPRQVRILIIITLLYVNNLSVSLFEYTRDT